MRFAFLAFGLLLTACAASGPVGYSPADDKGFGYADFRIETGRYRIVYQGSGGMPEPIVDDYALRRAAELTLDDGYDWFRIVARDVMREQRGGVSVGAGFGTGSYGRRSGVSLGVGGDLGRVGGSEFITIRIEALMGEGAKPDDGDAYDARSVLEAIAGVD